MTKGSTSTAGRMLLADQLLSQVSEGMAICSAGREPNLR